MESQKQMNFSVALISDISGIFNFQRDLISSFWPLQYNLLWNCMRMCRINFGIFVCPKLTKIKP